MSRKKIITLTFSLLLSTGMFMGISELQASTVCPTNSIQSISPEELWEEGVYLGKLSKLEKSLKEGFRPDQEKINEAFISLVLDKKRNCIRWLLSNPYGILRPDQNGVSMAFLNAAFFNHLDTLQWLLTQPSNLPLPDQNDVSGAFLNGAMNNQRGIMEWLLTQPSSLPLPDQDGVSMAFLNAASNSHRGIMEWLLTRPAGIPLPDQWGVNMAFANAAFNNHRGIMELLLTRPARIPLPDQEGINKAFEFAAKNNHREIMEWLLAGPSGVPLPDENYLTPVYRDLCTLRNRTFQIENILRIMDPLVPLQERIIQGRGPAGRAYEIHNFSNTRVPVSCESGRNSASSENQRLFDAILSQIESRIQGRPIVNIEIIHLRLLSAIDHVYAQDTQKSHLAKQALERAYTDENASLYLQKVMTFLFTLSPAAFDLWFEGFMDESITAYLNSQHQLSCTKGIKERILTGLRRIDPDLDAIFKPAEAPLLMKSFINHNYNVYNESVLRSIALMLKEKGISAQSKVDEAQRFLQNDIMLQLNKYKVEIPAEIHESVRAVLETFGYIYDEKIKPLL